VAGELDRRAGVHHIDADRLVLELSARGRSPDPEQGWLTEVEAEIRAATDRYERVSVEATGAWDSDWMLAEHLTAAGCRVLSVWVTAPVEVTLDRLAHRRTRKVPVSPQEARWIHAEASRRAASHPFTAVVDTAGPPEPSQLDDLLQHLE
jgi:cytidylate kinase